MVAVRERTKGDIGVMSINDFVEMARKLVDRRALTNEVSSPKSQVSS